VDFHDAESAGRGSGPRVHTQLGYEELDRVRQAALEALRAVPPLTEIHEYTLWEHVR
jgi:hypothetical protein